MCLKTLYPGLLTGCGQKWRIVRYYEGQLCGKKYPLCGSQFLISNVLGVLNSVLISILVHLSDGTLSVEIICCFTLVSNRPKTIDVTYIFQKKYTRLRPLLLRTELLECIMSKILHTNLFIRVYKCALFFLKFQLGNRHVYYALWNALSSYKVICITRQKYEVEQLPTPSFMKHGETQFMHHCRVQSMYQSLSWNLAGLRSRSKISCIFSNISMTK